MLIDKQKLKEEIEATIKVYQDACKPENLNYDYCINANLDGGICCLSKMRYYNLSELLKSRLFLSYLIKTPHHLSENREPMFPTQIIENNETLLQLHQARIEYLQNLLKEIE